MAKYGTSLYGSFVYGITTTITSIDPITGPSTGGQEFAINGDGMSAGQYDDEFTGAVLNPALWTSISAGGGSDATGTAHLELATGAAAGALGGVESVTTWSDAQGKIRVNVPSVSSYPATDVYPINFALWVDANNYALMRIAIGQNSADTEVECVVYKNAVNVASYTTSWTLRLSTFKILRWGTHVYFLANGSIIFDTKEAPSAAATFRIYADNAAENYDTSSIVQSFEFIPFVAFDDQIVHDPVVVSDTRLRGLTPPSLDAFDTEAAYAGLVDIAVVATTKATSADAYTYYFVDSLKVLNSEQFDVVMSFINDDLIETPSGKKKGL